MDLFVCQTGKKQVLLLRSEPHRVRCEFACCATLPWVTQAGNWSEEGGERWGWQRRRKKKKIFGDILTWMKRTWWCFAASPLHLAPYHTPAWDGEPLQPCVDKTACLGHQWRAELWKGWGKKKVLYRFPSCYIGWSGKPPGKLWPDPLAWI